MEAKLVQVVAGGGLMVLWSGIVGKDEGDDNYWLLQSIPWTDKFSRMSEPVSPSARIIQYKWNTLPYGASIESKLAIAVAASLSDTEYNDWPTGIPRLRALRESDNDIISVDEYDVSGILADFIIHDDKKKLAVVAAALAGQIDLFNWQNRYANLSSWSRKEYDWNWDKDKKFLERMEYEDEITFDVINVTGDSIKSAKAFDYREELSYMPAQIAQNPIFQLSWLAHENLIARNAMAVIRYPYEVIPAYVEQGILMAPLRNVIEAVEEPYNEV